MHSHSQSYRPKKSLGQNFLIDRNYQLKIVEAVRADYRQQTILEIGPGRGAITDHLVSFARQLVLIEKDVLLAKALARKYHAQKHVRVIEGDFLNWEGTLPGEVLVVGNLPYNVASQIFIKLLRKGAPYKTLFLMFQKEVAERCVASPGNKDYGILSVWSRLLSQPKILFHLPPTVFNPKPKVQSAFVRFDLLGVAYEQEKDFISFVKRVFGQRRKKISTILKKELRHLGTLTNEVATLLDLRAEVLGIDSLKLVFDAIR